jgi:hypothetical protein
VNPDAAAVLQALVAAKDGITARAIASVSGLDLVVTDDLLAALAVVGLVEPTAPGRWRPHPTIREHRYEQAIDGFLRLLAGEPLPALKPDPLESRQPQPDSTPQPLPLKQAAAELGVSWYTLRGWARLGRVPHTWTPGGRRRFDVEEIRRMDNGRPPHLPPRQAGMTADSETHPG